jgi:two-component system sensor histidine kinase VicK
VLLSLMLAQRLALPVRRLEEATRRLATGDLSARVRMHRRLLGRGDEMDNLTREFNAMAEKIETIDEERRAFLADVSHELKTPLCAIKGSAETLRDGAWRNPQAAPRFANTIAEQSDRLIRLVGDLLKLARLEAAAPPLTRHNGGNDSNRPRRGALGRRKKRRGDGPDMGSRILTEDAASLAVHELCERAANAVAPLFAERGVHLEVECGTTEVWGDADLLEQLLINLLANAARHSPRGSTTTLSARRTSSGTLLQVSDQGHGIAEEHLPKLGRRFYRVEEGRDRDSGGSGLGLAICRRIALAHGGKLNIESEVDRGTTVSVTLPA